MDQDVSFLKMSCINLASLHFSILFSESCVGFASVCIYLHLKLTTFHQSIFLLAYVKD